jgi:hypothetical protein
MDNQGRDRNGAPYPRRAHLSDQEIRPSRRAAGFRVRYLRAERPSENGAERFELYHRVVPGEVVAIVGPPINRAFPVLLLSDDPRVMDDVRRDLELYLVELGKPDPWAYARYHCTTLANAYSAVHWSYLREADS